MAINKYNARRYLDYSEDARLNEKELRKKYPQLWYIEDIKTDTQGFAFIESCKFVNSEKTTLCSDLCSDIPGTKHTLVIAFRGSQQIQDWFTDFNAWHTTFPYDNFASTIQVHKGFITAYKSIRYQIQAIMAECKSSLDRVVVCGHSLGGALAQLCAVDIQYNYGIYIECYPSGSPAVGNKAWAVSYNKRIPNTTRTYMRNDVVSTLPPKRFGRRLGGYTQVKQPWAIGPYDFFYGLKQWFKTKEDFAGNLTNHAIYLYKYWMEK